MDAEELTERMLDRERAANVRKHWVRLVTACNSRCVFCLDTDTPRNVYLTQDDVRREIKRGRDELNADKIILSGGEGSIHPKFVDFVRYARDIGYNRIQTVTNGYMFSKREFYRAAVEAGLGEITFSLHGHTPACVTGPVAVKAAATSVSPTSTASPTPTPTSTAPVPPAKTPARPASDPVRTAFCGRPRRGKSGPFPAAALPKRAPSSRARLARSKCADPAE